jgi:uncharacterized membrane protein (UPF0127 family)
MPSAGTLPVLGRTPILLAFLIGLLGWIAACSPSSGPQSAGVAPPTTTESTSARPTPSPRPTVTLPDGFDVTLEVAITPDELAQGLMFRPHLPADRGMLLVFSEERLPNIWMMNTLVALDIVYLDRTGTVVDLVTDAQPCPGEPCPRFTPRVPSQAVLEIPAGGALTHGIEIGMSLEFINVPEFPNTD